MENKKSYVVFNHDKCSLDGLVGVFDSEMDAKLAVADYALNSDNHGQLELEIVPIVRGVILP